MQILDGKLTSDKIKAEIARAVEEKVAKGGKRPYLVAVIVGENGASLTYVASKEKACKQVGFDSAILRFPEETSQEELLATVDKLNKDDQVDGFIVQLPLPKHIDEQAVIEAIDPAKDVDGFHPVNAGKMMLGLPCFYPATPYGIVRLMKEYGIETKGKHCVVVGRSNIVGRPVANMLSLKGEGADCTVTICHSHTRNIEKYTRDADIIVAAVGVPGYLKADMVKEGAVVIDVGVTRIPDATRKSGFRLSGDVDFAHVAPKCSYITPVPGGCGPMTIVSLMVNTLKAAEGK